MKNLFKKYYPIVKKELRNFNANRFELSRAFAKISYDDLSANQKWIETAKWHMLICKYLDMCRDEEKKFIDLLYFQRNSLTDVSVIFPLSLRSCHEWREKTLKNILLLAADEGLLAI